MYAVAPYRTISWNNVGEDVVLKSTLNKKTTNERSGDVDDVIAAFALFNIQPLRFRAMFEIKRNVSVVDVVTQSTDKFKPDGYR